MKLALIFSALAMAYAVANSGIVKSRRTVSLLMNREHFCPGIIFSQRFIVTTATCVNGKQANEISVLADTPRELGDSVKCFQIDEIMMKTPFGSRSIKENIAFLHTRENMYPIQGRDLSAHEQGDHHGINVIICGWDEQQVG